MATQSLSGVCRGEVPFPFVLKDHTHPATMSLFDHFERVINTAQSLPPLLQIQQEISSV
jgi:hypothetical protein